MYRDSRYPAGMWATNMGYPAVVWFLTPVRLAECRDLRKVIAGVIQGEELLRARRML